VYVAFWLGVLTAPAGGLAGYFAGDHQKRMELVYQRAPDSGVSARFR